MCIVKYAYTFAYGKYSVECWITRGNWYYLVLMKMRREQERSVMFSFAKTGKKKLIKFTWRKWYNFSQEFTAAVEKFCNFLLNPFSPTG